MKITKRQPRRIILENDRREELISVIYDIMVDNRTDDQEEDFLAAKEEMELEGEATDDELRDIQLDDIFQMGGPLTMEQKTVKITKRQLKRIIKEEKQKLLKEGSLQGAEERLADALDEYIMVLDESMGYDVPADVLKGELYSFVDGMFEGWDDAAQTYTKEEGL